MNAVALGRAGVAVGITAMVRGVTVVIAAATIGGSWWVLTRTGVHHLSVFLPPAAPAAPAPTS